jgi:hypothetical protein
MKKQAISWLVIIVFIVLGVFAFIYGNKPTVPTVGADGKINGEYSIAGIMALGKPYKCTFEKNDESSRIIGTIYTDGNNIYGEFRIKTDIMKDEFNSFLMVKDAETYVWTSLEDVGYKSPVTKSASKNASAEEQAQIVGTRDKMQYKCEPWQEVDNFTFETPPWIKFSELKK